MSARTSPPQSAAKGNISVTLNGDLTMHGITRSQTVSARVAVDWRFVARLWKFFRAAN